MNARLVVLVPALLALSLSSAGAQDAVVETLNRCVDPARPADSRVHDCTAVIQAQGIDPDEVAFAWLDLGLAYRAQGGDRQSELDAYGKALALQPALWQARANRAALYLEAGEMEAALADYLALRTSGPDKVQLYRAKSDIHYRTTRIEGTVSSRPDMDSQSRERADYASDMDSLARALEADFANRCRARAMAGLDLDAAAKDCDTVLAINSTNDTAHESRGIIEFRRRNWPAAMADFNTVLAATPGSPRSLFMKGVVERRMGNTTAGDADIASAQSADPHVGFDYAEVGILP